MKPLNNGHTWDLALIYPLLRGSTLSEVDECTYKGTFSWGRFVFFWNQRFHCNGISLSNFKQVLINYGPWDAIDQLPFRV